MGVVSLAQTGAKTSDPFIGDGNVSSPAQTGAQNLSKVSKPLRERKQIRGGRDENISSAPPRAFRRPAERTSRAPRAPLFPARPTFRPGARRWFFSFRRSEREHLPEHRTNQSLAKGRTVFIFLVKRGGLKLPPQKTICRPRFRFVIGISLSDSRFVSATVFKYDFP